MADLHIQVLKDDLETLKVAIFENFRQPLVLMSQQEFEKLILDYEKQKARFYKKHEAHIDNPQNEEIKEALKIYHAALSNREHGGVAANHFVQKVENILEMHWR